MPEQALVESDPDVRRELYTRLQNIVLNDLPFLPPYYFPVIGGVNKRVHNLYHAYWNVVFNAETWWVEP